MQMILLLVHVLAAAAIIGLVLIQHGKGADIGASFGSGASQTVFGSQGSGSFLVKLTAGLAAVFLVTCLSLNYIVTSQAKKRVDSLIQTSPVTQPSNLPSGGKIPSP